MEKESGVDFLTKIKLGLMVIVITGLIGVLGYVLSERHEGYEKRGTSIVSVTVDVKDSESFGRGVRV